MQIVNSQNLKTIQIDVTSYCNSFCGSCIRNIKGGPFNPLVVLQHMSWDVWHKIVDFCKSSQVDRLPFNGNYGDLSNHPDIINMLEYLYEKSPNTTLNIHTNGGARNANFWKDLAKVVNKFPASYVTFSIDGLEDTNHIYRRGVDFDRIMENATAFISTGGNARWRMIVFDHNKHQLEEASNRAKEMGFFSFSLNRSFSSELKVDAYKEFPQNTITAPDVSEVNILRKNYEFTNSLQPNNSFVLLKNYKKLESKCPWQQMLQIQINHLGEVWPCCYISLSSGTAIRDRFKYLDQKILEYGKTFNNLNYYDLTEILEHKFFQEDLPHAWEKRLLGICNEKCGV